MDIGSFDGPAGVGVEWTDGQTSSIEATPETRHAESASVTLLGVEVLNRTMDEALAQVEAMMTVCASTSLFFVNAHTLNTAVGDPVFRRLLNEAELVFPDGTGARWAATCRGVRLKANLNGTDLVPALLARGRGLRCFVLGSTPEVAAGAAEHIRRSYSGCTVVGHHHGFLDKELTQRVIQTINGSGADVLLVGMGNPLQEYWISRNRARLQARLCVGVGGLLGYWAGATDRAPLWMRRWGIEWLHVLRRHPWKFRRYVLGNPLFLARMLTWLPADLRKRPTQRHLASPASATVES